MNENFYWHQTMHYLCMQRFAASIRHIISCPLFLPDCVLSFAVADSKSVFICFRAVLKAFPFFLKKRRLSSFSCYWLGCYNLAARSPMNFSFTANHLDPLPILHELFYKNRHSLVWQYHLWASSEICNMITGIAILT